MLIGRYPVYKAFRNCRSLGENPAGNGGNSLPFRCYRGIFVVSRRKTAGNGGNLCTAFRNSRGININLKILFTTSHTDYNITCRFNEQNSRNYNLPFFHWMSASFEFDRMLKLCHSTRKNAHVHSACMLKRDCSNSAAMKLKYEPLFLVVSEYLKV